MGVKRALGWGHGGMTGYWVRCTDLEFLKHEVCITCDCWFKQFEIQCQNRWESIHPSKNPLNCNGFCAQYPCLVWKLITMIQTSADSYTLEIKVTMSIRSIRDSCFSANISSSQSQRSRKLTWMTMKKDIPFRCHKCWKYIPSLSKLGHSPPLLLYTQD